MAKDQKNPRRSRLEPMREGSDLLVMTDRQAEDHGEHVRGEHAVDQPTKDRDAQNDTD